MTLLAPGVIARRVSSASTSFIHRFHGLSSCSSTSISLRATCEGRAVQSRTGFSAGWIGGGVHLSSVASEGEKRERKRKMKKKKPCESSLMVLAGDEEAQTALEAELFQEKYGSIHLILGPMFAGKSTALLKRAQEEATAGRRVALVKSDKDARYGLSAVVTHDGVQMPCYAVPDLATFKAQVGEKLYNEFDVIGIDEAQFFTDLYDFCLTAADYEGKTVIAAGLDGDFLRRKFGSTVDLVRVADSVVKLSSRCEICGKPAIFSFRKTLDIQTEIIGGADVYMPVCRQHFVGGQMVVDSACTVLEAHQTAKARKES